MLILDNNPIFGKKISDNIWEDYNKQLICRNCIIARTGSYDYLESEVLENGDENKIIKVYRTPEEVFSPRSIASFENKPFVNDHPEEDVSLNNYRDLQCGFIRNVRRGTKDLSNCLMCDIVVTDPEVIELIKSGEKRELSLGYDTNIIQKDGKYLMTNIIGNHLALVDSGRAGCATIRDSRDRLLNKIGGQRMNLFKKSKSVAKLYDEDIIEVEEIKDDEVIPQEEVAEEMVETQDEATPDMVTVLGEIKNVLVEILAAVKPAETAPVADEDEVEGETIEEENIDEVNDEENVEEEIVEDADEDVEELMEDEDMDEDLIEDEDEVEEHMEDEDECELIDDDEEVEEVIEEKHDACAKKRDAKSVFKKFAKAKDSRTVSTSRSVQSAFQKRYNSQGGI